MKCVLSTGRNPYTFVHMEEHFNFSIESAGRIIRRFRAIAGVSFVTIGIGTVFYHLIEHMRWLDSLYFSVMTLTTVGFGDFAPKTDIGKLFTVGYVIFGVGIIAALANNLLKTAAARRFIKNVGGPDDR